VQDKGCSCLIFLTKSKRLYAQNSAYGCPESSPAPELKLAQPLYVHLLMQYQLCVSG